MPFNRTEYQRQQHSAKWFVAWFRALCERRPVSLTIPEYRKQEKLQ